MTEATGFLRSFARALAAMNLYVDGHPARARAIDLSYDVLLQLQAREPEVQFSFLGDEVLYGAEPLGELQGWELGSRLASVGVQRVEFAEAVSREEYDSFLNDMLRRLSSSLTDTAEASHSGRSGIRFGALGIAGAAPSEELPAAPTGLTLEEEGAAIRWLHHEVERGAELSPDEADAVVRSLWVAMHGESQIVIPLLQLEELDQYTTTHALNVAVLVMALAEFLGVSAREARAVGVAGLLHDVGMVRVPRDILMKPGKLTEAEQATVQRHPADGARMLLGSRGRLDLAAVVAYEHHIMLNDEGYPSLHFPRECHPASKMVHICDVYDALRTKRPYRDAWESEQALGYFGERAGTEFDPELAQAFTTMMRRWGRRVVALREGSPVEARQGVA